MAFGSGVLISAVAFDLMEEADDTGGLAATAIGFLGGAVVYSGRTWRSPAGAPGTASGPGDQQTSEAEQSGSGAAIAVGALLDGIPESVVLGLGLLGGGAVSCPCWPPCSSPTSPRGCPARPG